MASYRTKAERHAEVRRWRSSGSTAAAYCAEHGISTVSLRRWRIAAEGSPPARAPSFVRVEVASCPSEVGVTLEVGRARLRVQRGFDATLLREVVDALTADERAP